PLQWAAIRQDYLRWWFMVPATTYLRWNVEVLFVAVFPLAPLLMASVARWRRAIAIGTAAIWLVVICLVSLGAVVMPLPYGQTWSMHDIAARMMLDGGTVAPSSWSLRAVPLVQLVGLLSVGALGVIGIQHWRRRPERQQADLVILTLAVLHVACINVLWLYN